MCRAWGVLLLRCAAALMPRRKPTRIRPVLRASSAHAQCGIVRIGKTVSVRTDIASRFTPLGTKEWGCWASNRVTTAPRLRANRIQQGMARATRRQTA
jgi:hypothetical protein